MNSFQDTRQRFESALDDLLIEIREDPNILAAILCGSLSHDQVWDLSDIDLVLITIDDKKMVSRPIAIVKDHINVHSSILTRG